MIKVFKKFKKVAKVIYKRITLTIWFVLCCFLILASLYVSVIGIAIIINSTVPLYFEVTVEGTYPVSEGITTMIMTWLNNFVGLVFLLIMLDQSVGK